MVGLNLGADLLTAAMWAWMGLLTLGNIVAIQWLYTMQRERMQDRKEGHLRDEMRILMNTLHAKDVTRDRELRAAIERFIAQVQADPVAAHRMHINIVDITNLLSK